MTSASTKRRHKRNAPLRWRRKGNEVVEAGRNGRRVLMAVDIWPDDHASLDLAASAPELKREVERLRAAMVHAMDDCEWIANRYDLRGDVKATARRAQKTIKTALEKK